MLKAPWTTDRKIALITQQRHRLYRMALSWSGDAMLADDLVQDALSRGISNRHQLQDSNKLSAWLFRILHNCWMSYLRKYRPAIDLDMDEITSDESPEIRMNQSQIVTSVRAAITKLPMGQRQVITLIDLEEHTYAEVSEILEIPLGTVMSRLSRSRESLKKYLAHLEPSAVIQSPQLRSIK